MRKFEGHSRPWPRNIRFRIFLCAPLCFIVFVIFSLACSRGREAQATSQAAENPVASHSTPAPQGAPSDVGPAPTINANRAMQYVKEIVAFGPRPIGSANHKKVEDYILTHLKGDIVEQDAFTIEASEGKFPVRNIVAKFPGSRDGIIVIASHYDTNWP